MQIEHVDERRISMETPAPARAHAQLRSATRIAHARAEAVPVLASLLAGEIDRARYGAHLAVLSELFGDWERQCAAFLANDVAAAGWHYASRLAGLAADLDELGVVAEARPIVMPPRVDPSAAARWG